MRRRNWGPIAKNITGNRMHVLVLQFLSYSWFAFNFFLILKQIILANSNNNVLSEPLTD